MRSGAKRLPADFLLSFTFLTALAILILNDFVLKSQFPGVLSGKLSDIAGPVVVTLLAVAILEAVVHALDKAGWAKPWWFTAAAIAVVCLFAAIKLTTFGSAAYVGVTTSLMDLARPLAGLVGWEWIHETPEPVRDIWDAVLALMAIPITFATGLVWRRPEGTSPRSVRR